MFIDIKQWVNNDKIDFRFLPFSLVLLYVIALLCSELYLGSYAVLGRYFRIYPIPYFVDLEILLCGIDAIREGANPYTALCFEGEAYFNYPYIWGFLSIFPFITAANHIYIGLSLIILFFLSLYFFIGKLSFKQALFYAAIFISPAVMLGLERGNSDVIIFLILMLVPLFVYKSKILSSILILCTSMLKIFPIGALIWLFNNPKKDLTKSVWLFIGVVFSFLIYIYLMLDSIIQVSDKTPRPYKEASYGLGGMPSFILGFFNVSAEQSKWIFLGFALLCSMLFLIIYKYLNKKVGLPKIEQNAKGAAYLMGSGIFLMTCLIGYNWEYRLIFLIFTLPQILKWGKEYRILKMAFLFAFLLLAWCSLILPVVGLLIPNGFAYFIAYILTMVLFYMHLFVLLKLGLKILNHNLNLKLFK